MTGESEKRHLCFAAKKAVLSDRQIEVFRELYKNRFGMELSCEDAHDQGMRLITLFRTLIKTPLCLGAESIFWQSEKT